MTKVARRPIAGMSYAASTILSDRTEGECNPPRFTAHVVDIREPVATRFFNTPNPEERDEQFRIDYCRRYDRPWCLGHLSLVARNTRKLGTKTERQRDTKMATATERSVRGRNRVRGSQVSDGQPHRYFLPWSGDDPRLVLFLRSPTTTLNATTRLLVNELLFAKSDRTRVSPWISRSRVDSGVNPARRGARVRGQ